MSLSIQIVVLAGLEKELNGNIGHVFKLGSQHQASIARDYLFDESRAHGEQVI